MSQDNTKGEVHKKHRQRMRDKFKESPDAMKNHELLEMLLFYAIPRKNTNEIAHNLLKLTNENFAKVFHLNKMQLLSVEGLGEVSAEFFEIIKEISKRIEKESYKLENKKITTQNIKKYLLGEFYGLDTEYFLMICVDRDCNIIDKHILSKGSETAATVSMKEVLQNAIADKASFVFLAHNHPNGLLIPSDSDIDFTRVACEALALIEVAVLEHYIVTDKDCFGIIRGCNLYKNR